MSSLTDWSAKATMQVPCQLSKSGSIIESETSLMPNLIKLDVEGNELAVLIGFGDKLADPCIHTIVFEDCKHVSSSVKEHLRGCLFVIEGSLVRNEQSRHHLKNYIVNKR